MILQSNIEHLTGGCAEVPRLIVNTTTRGVPTRPQPIKIVVYPGRRGVGNVSAKLKKENPMEQKQYRTNSIYSTFTINNTSP